MFCRLVMIALLAAPVGAWAQRPPAVIPGSPDVVLERLPAGYAALVPSGAPGTITLAQINRLLGTAARTGDARLATRAESLLSRIPANNSAPDILMARAFSAQHHHDFARALELLDTVITENPRQGDARLARAQVQLVQGRLDRARSDCAALAIRVDANLGLVCLAAVSLRRGDLDAAASMAERWLAQSDADAPLRRHVLVIRAETAARAGAADADTWFRRALKLAPDDVRTLAAYARHLRDTGRNQDTLTLLAAAPDSDGLHLQRTLAAHAVNAPDAAELVKSQRRRYGLAHAVGSEPELRDEAEFLLTLGGDAAGALALAQRNFQTQRDYEDVDVLRRAAMAAKRPQALDALNAWARSQQLELPPMDGGKG